MGYVARNYRRRLLNSNEEVVAALLDKYKGDDDQLDEEAYFQQ